MTPAVGQRWLWKLNGINGKSETVIEITNIDDASYVHYVYVQVMVKGYPEDVVGRSDYSSLSAFTSPNMTYLIGQDKIQNG